MANGLIKLIFGGFLVLGSLNAFNQVHNKNIPEEVKGKINEYTAGVNYCKDVKINYIDEKINEDRNGDKINDKVVLYNIEGCDVVPNYFIFTYNGLKEGGFSSIGKCETQNLRDKDWKTLPIKTNEW